jgi:hypothetical protein
MCPTFLAEVFVVLNMSVITLIHFLRSLFFRINIWNQIIYDSRLTVSENCMFNHPQKFSLSYFYMKIFLELFD